MQIGDGELLRVYVVQQDQAAFAQVVERHIDWVYSAARRITREEGFAEDVTQGVFLALARKAGELTEYASVAGWLFRATQFAGRTVLKRERIRKLHEVQAMKMATNAEPTADTFAYWSDISGKLEDTVGHLGKDDREAILLRFYQQMSLSEVATVLGIRENTARMRVTRAVRKLRQRLGGDAEMLTGALLTYGLTKTPAHLAAAVSTGVHGTAALAVYQGVKGMMLMAKMKTAAVIVGTVALTLAAGFGIMVARAGDITATSPIAGPALTDEQKMDATWKDLEGQEPAASRAMLAFLAKPDQTIAYFKPRLAPLNITAAQVLALIVDLGSNDEKVWRPAFETLRYQDPRLAIKLQTLDATFQEQPIRNRMIALMGDRNPDAFAKMNGDNPIFLEHLKDGFYNYTTKHASWEAIVDVKQLGGAWYGGKRKWLQANRALTVLAQINTPDALAILHTMTTGHPDADPTTTAKTLLAQLAARATQPASTTANFDDLWTDMQSPLPISQAAMLKFAANPDQAVAYFKPRLLPLTITETQVGDLLQSLGSDNPDEWTPAFHKLEYFDPRLAVSLPTLMDEYTDQQTRTRLVDVLCDVPPGTFANKDIKLYKINDFYDFGDKKYGSWGAEHDISKLGLRSPKQQWARLVRALIVLGHIASPDSIAILKDMATGNPDAQPTRVAKEELDALVKPY